MKNEKTEKEIEKISEEVLDKIEKKEDKLKAINELKVKVYDLQMKSLILVEQNKQINQLINEKVNEINKLQRHGNTQVN